MKVLKDGGHRLFEEDAETSRVVSKMLRDLKGNGMDAVRKYSQQFDDWAPDRFELSEKEITSAIAKVPIQVIRDTNFCQENVRNFAKAQLKTMLPLEVETLPGVILGHRPSRLILWAVISQAVAIPCSVRRR